METFIGLETRYRPFDNYATRQNPPDFSWPYEEDVNGYDLIICRDKALTDVAYRRDGHHSNYYNFPYVFVPGLYYWAVRSHKGEKTSDWSRARRFLLREDAREFPVPDVETLLSRIPEGHPRIYTTQAQLEEFRREMLSDHNDYLPMVRRALKDFMARPFPEEREADPLDATPETMYSPFLKAADVTKLACNMVMFAGFYYLVTQDEEVGRYGVECLMKLAQWDPDGVTSYTLNDQAHRRIAVYSTLAYDWLYPLLTPEQQACARGMIGRRVERMCCSEYYNIRNFDKCPFDSHGGTAIGYVALISLALYRELPEAEELLRYTLPLYINSLTPWSNEDGGWAQGTYYWSCNIFGKKLIEALYSGGIMDLYRKTWQKNEPLFALYCCPEGSIGAFGDNSYIPATGKVASSLSVLAHRIATPEAKWVRNQIGYLTAYGHTDDPDPAVCMYDRLYPPEEAYIPETMPREHYFQDIGWVAMHSDLKDPERISIFFKSSWYGSFNHSHPDQNSFIIQAYGKPLAIDSGYYDIYNSPFDRDYTRKTYAHNAITYNNGKGQPAMDIQAKGKITDYLSHSRAALAGGDASQAYKGGIKRARRWLLYLKPDLLVVIDDLAAKEGRKSRFEYWLNAQKWAFLAPDGLGGRLITDNAQLDLRIHTPQQMEAHISHDFSGTDGVPLYPVYEGHARWPVQKRIWFQTEPCEQTRILSTLDIHHTNTPPRKFPAEYGDHCVMLKLDHGCTLALNRDGTHEKIDTGCFSFRGTAAMVGPGAVMLIDGTELTMEGTVVFSSKEPISAVIGGNELSISALAKDAQVTVHAPGAHTITTREGVAVNADSLLYGATVELQEDTMVFSLYNGCYDFLLGGLKAAPGFAFRKEKIDNRTLTGRRLHVRSGGNRDENTGTQPKIKCT